MLEQPTKVLEHWNTAGCLRRTPSSHEYSPLVWLGADIEYYLVCSTVINFKAGTQVIQTCLEFIMYPKMILSPTPSVGIIGLCYYKFFILSWTHWPVISIDFYFKFIMISPCILSRRLCCSTMSWDKVIYYLETASSVRIAMVESMWFWYFQKHEYTVYMGMIRAISLWDKK